MEEGKMRAISVSFLVAVFLISMAAIAAPARASDCTVTVTAPDSIQAAVDANPEGAICLSGEFHQSVTLDSADSGITLRGAGTAILDGTGTADSGTTLDTNFGIRLVDGVDDVTIENLEIRHYHGPRGSAISTWDVSTSDITVSGNVLLHNAWNGVLVGSEGGFIHENWKVEDNTVADNGFVGIELTNCNECKIEKNTVTGSGFAGIVIQARNTVPDSGLVTVSDVVVEDNDISDSGYAGIYVLALASQPLPPFDPIDAASASFNDVKVEKNVVDGAGVLGILVWSYLDGTVDAAKMEENVVSESGSFDLYDLGDGTIWEGNTCDTSSPDGLCNDS
ncbi:MAG: right-handed parallel beta-helix repeat-containing protein [Thermoplasmata archaeon]